MNERVNNFRQRRSLSVSGRCVFHCDIGRIKQSSLHAYQDCGDVVMVDWAAVVTKRRCVGVELKECNYRTCCD